MEAWRYHDRQTRLTRRKVGGLFDRSYTYDAGGNVRSITDHTGAQPRQQYGYDHRDRLTRWTLGHDTGVHLQPARQPDQQAGPGALHLPGAGSPRPHAPSSIGGQPATYDANGNLERGQGRSTTWTWENRPRSVTAGGVTETYAYDADGARVGVTRDGTTTVYLAGLWEERVGAGGGRALFAFNGQPIAYRDDGAGRVVYLHGDHLGSVSVATTTTPTGTAARLSVQEFDPWGAVRAGGIRQTALNYTGQRLDTTGLLY